MAIPKYEGGKLKSVIVEAGDTLSQIAVDYCGDYDYYKRLAAINDIVNPDLIAVGQEINMDSGGSGSGSSSSSASSPKAAGKATINQFGVLSTNPTTLFATWTWNETNTASYQVSWTYDIGDGVWFNGSTSKITVEDDSGIESLYRQSTYSIPSNARQVRFKVKPISKTFKKNNNDTSYWTASWSETKTWTSATPLTAPGTPTVEIANYKLTATLNNISIIGATHIDFQVVKNNSNTPFSTKRAEIVSSYASYVFDIEAGGEYKVRCRAYSDADKILSDWSDYSANNTTIPSTPESITEIKALSATSVQISWTTVENATGYVVEYTTQKMYFDSSTEVKSITVSDAVNYATITGLTSGEEYFFRVKAQNSVGDSGWSGIQSISIGGVPAAPTTWSSTSTAIVGNPVTLYWVHNVEDGSRQTYAELQLYIGDMVEEYTIENTDEEAPSDKTNQWVLDTTPYPDGTTVKWRIRTAGITKEFGPWSIQRTIEINAPATLQLSMTDVSGDPIETLTAFPFFIEGIAGPATQTPLGYYLSVKSNAFYETVDNLGNPKIVNPGDEVYSKYFDVNQDLLVEMSAGNIDLESGIDYTVTCALSMNTGITTTASLTFTVSWSGEQCVPNAEIGIDEETMTANIRPYCEDTRVVNYRVEYDDATDVYTKSETEISAVWGEPVRDLRTTTGERVYSGVSAEGEATYYCVVNEIRPVTDVLLSVYRREFDGSFTELASGLDGAKATTIADPHPALDYARYRIIATDKSTGAVAYYDPPGYPVGYKAVIIQWDEDWSSFETSEEDSLEHPPWSGSMLKLPYNIDVSDAHSPDISLVEYAGRAHPVSYYGTQLGVTANWSLDVPKEDKETVYALRRLARWMGDVYVREPSGTGYWANITVSFSQKHKELTIPVSLSITQVEGGA